MQGSIILLFLPLLANPIALTDIVKSFGLMFLLAVTISKLGIILASVIKTMQRFQVITYFLLMPMFFLSGAIFLLLDAPRRSIFLSRVNPLTYGIDAIGYVMLRDASLQFFPLWLNIAVLLAVSGILSIANTLFFNRQQ